MPHVLIVCYGNPLRGDDAVGWRAAERLQAAIDNPEVEILTVHQLTPELMDPLSRVARAIFIDAAQGGEPGEIRERRIDAAAAIPNFTHHATPEGLVGGALRLYGQAPEAVLFTIAAASFEIGEELSAPVRDAVAVLVERVLASIPSSGS